MLRIPTFIGKVRRAETVNRVAPALEVVSHPRPKTINLVAATLEREVAEHVIEGAILQHQHDDVLDPIKAVGLSDSHRPLVCSIVWRRSETGQALRIWDFWASNSASVNTPDSRSSPSCLSCASLSPMSGEAGAGAGAAAMGAAEPGRATAAAGAG